MSALTAVGVIAKGNQQACIALVRILLPENYDLAESDDGEFSLSFVEEGRRPISLDASPWARLECGIPLIREDEKADSYQRKDILSISKELHLDMQILNVPLEEDYPTYLHLKDGECVMHTIFIPPYSDEIEDMLEEYDEEEDDEEGDEWLPGCDPQYCSLDEFEEVWYESFYSIFSANGLEDCVDDMCVPFDPIVISKLKPE